MTVPVATRTTAATTRKQVRRRPGDTQAVLVVALTIAATTVAVYDLFLLALVAR
jgi:hypothetical protein